MIPLLDKVVLRRHETETMKGGLHLPQSSGEIQNLCDVVAVGPGRIVLTSEGTFKHRPMQVHVGDVVVIGRWTGDEVTIDGVDYLVVPEDKILVIHKG